MRGSPRLLAAVLALALPVVLLAGNLAAGPDPDRAAPGIPDPTIPDPAAQDRAIRDERARALARAVEVSAHAQAAGVEIGRPFAVFVTVRHPPGLRVDVPASFPLGAGFEAGRPARRRGGDRVTEFELEVISWRVGARELPPIPVVYTADGAVRSATSDPVPVDVTSLLGPADVAPGPAMLRGPAAPVAVMRPDPVALALAAAVACAALAVAFGLAWWLVRRRRRAADPVTEERPLAPADREALDALAAVERADLASGEARRRAFTELSRIVARYIDRRFAIPAGDMTSAEIVTAVARSSDPALADRAARAALQVWMTSCDLVKYAAAEPDPDDVRRAVTGARAWVGSTAAPPSPPSPSPSPSPAPPPSPMSPPPRPGDAP